MARTTYAMYLIGHARVPLVSTHQCLDFKLRVIEYFVRGVVFPHAFLVHGPRSTLDR